MVLNTFTGDAESPEEIAAFKANVREIADEAQAAGIRLCIETDSNLLPTAEIGRPILDEIGHDWVQFNYDPGNVRYYTGAVPEQDLEFALDRLVQLLEAPFAQLVIGRPVGLVEGAARRVDRPVHIGR